MKKRNQRMDLIKQVIAGQEISSQEELLRVLTEEGYDITQATLSRDLKQMKVAKAASSDGKYVYVLPNDIMYKRNVDHTANDSQKGSGFLSLQFSGNLAVIKTRPGYASSIAYDIDNRECPHILGTIAGDDTILLVLAEPVHRNVIVNFLNFLGVTI